MRSAFQVTNFINHDTSLTDFYNFVTCDETNFNYDINEGGRCGWTALQSACHHANLPLIHALLAMGADPNRARNSDYTALYDAIDSDNIEAVKLLRQYGARLDADNMDYLNQARKKNNMEIFTYLNNTLTDVECNALASAALRGADSNAYVYEIRKQFKNAILNQDYQQAKKLLIENNINLLDSFYSELLDPPLRTVVLQGNLKMTQLFVEHGAFLTDERDNKAHSIAARKAGHVEIARFLENIQHERYQRLKREAEKQKEVGKIAKAHYYQFSIFHNKTHPSLEVLVNNNDKVNAPARSTLLINLK